MAAETLPGQFEPYPEGGPSPERIDGLEGTESPSRVDLREVPIGTIIQFHGIHSGSMYISEVIDRGNGREIILWLLRARTPAIGSIDQIVAQDLKVSLSSMERGVMQLRANYCLPEFYPSDDYLYGIPGVPLRITKEMRTEPYLKIFVRKPSN